MKLFKITSILFAIYCVFSCSSSEKEIQKRKILAEFIDSNFVLTDSIIYYTLDSSVMKLKYPKPPRFREYTVCLWLSNSRSNEDVIEKCGNYSIENSQIVMNELDLKGNHPDSLFVTLDIYPVNTAFVNLDEPFHQRHMHRSKRFVEKSKGCVIHSPGIRPKYAFINFGYLEGIDDHEIKNYCLQEVKKLVSLDSVR